MAFSISSMSFSLMLTVFHSDIFHPPPLGLIDI